MKHPIKDVRRRNYDPTIKKKFIIRNQVSFIEMKYKIKIRMNHQFACTFITWIYLAVHF